MFHIKMFVLWNIKTITMKEFYTFKSIKTIKELS